MGLYQLEQFSAPENVDWNGTDNSVATTSCITSLGIV